MADHRIYGDARRRVSVPVQTARLDELLPSVGIDRLDVLKMDIQGAEALAFEGMQRTLRANPNIRLLMEYWPWGIRQTGRDPFRLLRDIRHLGLQIYEIDADAGSLVPATDDARLAARTLERQHMNLLVQRASLAERPIALVRLTA
jgi:hypothetical protein